MQKHVFRNHGNKGWEGEKFISSPWFFGCIIVGSVFENVADGFGVNSSHFHLKYLNMTYNLFFKETK